MSVDNQSNWQTDYAIWRERMAIREAADPELEEWRRRWNWLAKWVGAMVLAVVLSTMCALVGTVLETIWAVAAGVLGGGGH